MNRIKKSALAISLSILFIFLPIYSQGIESIKDFDKLMLLDAGAIQMQVSSHDPDGGNDDYGNYRYSAGGENVMFDDVGPGIINRIWLTKYNQEDSIRFYFDDETSPRINKRIIDFFDGKNTPFFYPLLMDDTVSSGGMTCYLPFPYKKSLKITTNGSLYYNIGYEKLPDDSGIESWTGFEDVSDVLDILNRCGEDPRTNVNYENVEVNADIPGGHYAEILNIDDGPKSIGQLLLKINEVEFHDIEPVKLITDDGRAHKGWSQFAIEVKPDADSVWLIRRLDYGAPEQKANVYIDNVFVGTWFNPGYNLIDRWLNSSFLIPKDKIYGKNSLTVRIYFVSAQIDWNEFYYWVKCDSVITDSIDVGNIASENSHSYQITSQSWSGKRTFSYPRLNDSSSINSAEILENVYIKIFYDGEDKPSVEAPLGMFFGMGIMGAVRMKSLPLGVTDSNELYCYFPIPFEHSISIHLDNLTNYQLKDVSLKIKYQKLDAQAGSIGYFHACYREENPPVYDRDYKFLNVDGFGKLVGIVLEGRYNNSSYLEGDERFYIDSSLTPVFNGTGTEDFFNGAYYFINGGFNLPFHGLSNVVGTNRTIYRFFLLDPITFLKKGDFGIEHGAANTVYADYRSLTFYYMIDSSRMKMTDYLDVGNKTSKEQHNYLLNSSFTLERTGSYCYEGDFDLVSCHVYFVVLNHG